MPAASVPVRAIALALLLVGAAAPRAGAQNFTVPSECKNGVSGIDDIYADFDPVVTVTDPNGAVVPLVGALHHNSSGWWAPLNITNAFVAYRFRVSYTPFLSTDTHVKVSQAGPQYVLVPPPGEYDVEGYHLYSYVAITILQPFKKQPWPNALVEMAPDYEGSDPYLMVADEKGVLTINCFTAIPGGNPATVTAPDHSRAYDIDYTFTPIGNVEGSAESVTSTFKSPGPMYAPVAPATTARPRPPRRRKP